MSDRDGSHSTQQKFPGVVDLSAASARGGCGPEEAVTCFLAVTQELNAATDLESGLARVAELVKRFVPYTTWAVLLLDDLGHELSFAHAEGFPPQVVKHWRFGMGQGIVGSVARTRQPILVDDVSEDPRYIKAVEDVGSELALPLVAKGRTVGVLDIGGPEPGFFGVEDQRLLRFLADHLAGAIENARLYQNMRDQARTLSLLHEVSRELTAILDRRELLERVAVLVKRLIDYDIFTVMLWNEQSQLLEPSISLFGDGPRIDATPPVPLGYGISGTAAALRQSIRVPNVHLDPRYVSCSERDLASELAVPMEFKDRLIGVIDLESTRFDAFSQHHQQLLATLGSSLAIALENARLYEKLQREERKLEEDLSTAREVQKQLLPKSTPWIPGLQMAVAYRPARHLGGDFYDFLPYGRGQVAIAVGDVAGKSTSAALYGSLAIGMLREYAEDSSDEPSTILSDMNDKLGQLGFDNRFLAMIFAVYDSETRRLTLANSGLPYAYLLRGRSIVPIEVGGVPLGLLEDREYEQTTIQLEVGDTVVIASDGVEECQNEQEVEFGPERVRGTLQRLADGSAKEIADGLLEATRLFSRHTEAYDDRTIVALKVTNGS